MANKPLHTNEMVDPTDEFEVMYKVNSPLIYRFMFWRTKDEMLAEDLTSNVFEKAWRSRTTFKNGSYKAWLYKIAHNTLIDYWRKKKDLAVDDITLSKLEGDSVELGKSLDQTILIASLKKALIKLPAEMRMVVEMRFVKGLSSKQTAEQLGISESNVRVIQYRALGKLRGYLK